MKYLIIVEKTATGFSAYSPDIPGCIATGDTADETERNMKEAIEFHLDGLKRDAFSLPMPSTRSVYVEVAAGENLGCSMNARHFFPDENVNRSHVGAASCREEWRGHEFFFRRGFRPLRGGESLLSRQK